LCCGGGGGGGGDEWCGKLSDNYLLYGTELLTDLTGSQNMHKPYYSQVQVKPCQPNKL